MIENKCNNFAKFNHVESKLLLGDPEIYFNEEITICIPTFNRPILLREAIESSLNQKTTIKYKVIVIDNDPNLGETDTLRTILSFKDNKIAYYKNEENLGLFGNMNRCIQLAKTKYVSILHDDDLLDFNYIETITKYLHKKPDIGCICVSFRQLNSPFNLGDKLQSSGFRLKLKKMIFHNRLCRIPDADNYFLHRNIFGPPTCGIIFNRNLCLHSGGWNEDYFPAADWFYMIYFNKKYKVYRIPEILASYRWESNTSLRPNIMHKFYQQTNEVISSYNSIYKFFYHEIIRQIQNDYIRYYLNLDDSQIQKFSKIRMKILLIIQRFFNLRYISFN